MVIKRIGTGLFTAALASLFVAGVLSAATPESLPTQHRLCMVVLSPCTASSCQDWCDVNHPGTTGICGNANCCNCFA